MQHIYHVFNAWLCVLLSVCLYDFISKKSHQAKEGKKQKWNDYDDGKSLPNANCITIIIFFCLDWWYNCIILVNETIVIVEINGKQGLCEVSWIT